MILDEKRLEKKLQNQKIDPSNYEIENRNDQITVKVHDSHTSYYLHSKYAPQKQAERFVEEKYSESQNLVVYGLGLGYHIQALLKKLKPSQSLYIIECNLEITKIAFEQTNIKEDLKANNVYCYITDDLLALSQILNEIAQLEGSTFIAYEPSIKTIPKKLERIKDLLENQNIERKSFDVFKQQLINNYTSNTKQNYPNAVKILKDQFKNIPCMIVSAGPSLHQNVMQLKKVQQKALILSVGRSCRVLQEYGINPDIVMETDCQPIIMNHFIDVDIEHIPLIFLPTAYSALNYLDGDKLLVYEESFCPLEEAKYTIDTGGSVATTALSLAIEMGCNPITFVGQDLCYTDAKTHYDSTQEVVRRKAGKYIEGISGEVYYTTPSLYKFLRWIEDKIRKHPQNTFYNSTAKGAFIQGTHSLPLEEWAETLPMIKEDFKNKLKNMIKTHMPQEEIKIFTCTIQMIK